MSSSESDQSDDAPEGLFVAIDESDPFEQVELHVRTDDGTGIKIGSIPAAPGRYEVTNVGQEASRNTAESPAVRKARNKAIETLESWGHQTETTRKQALEEVVDALEKGD